MHKRLIGSSITFCVILLSLTYSCVSIDSRALEAQPVAGATGNIRAAFSNYASYYKSTGEFIGPATMADAFNVPAQKADTVYVWRISEKDLLIQFRQAGRPIIEQRYSLNDGFRIDDKGAIQIRIATECGGHDSPVIGCAWASVALFQDTNGDLNVIRSGGGAGMLAIIPMAVYGKHLSIFSRIAEAPQLREGDLSDNP